MRTNLLKYLSEDPPMEVHLVLSTGPMSRLVLRENRCLLILNAILGALLEDFFIDFERTASISSSRPEHTMTTLVTIEEALIFFLKGQTLIIPV